jgi:thiamine transport system permease protein
VLAGTPLVSFALIFFGYPLLAIALKIGPGGRLTETADGFAAALGLAGELFVGTLGIALASVVLALVLGLPVAVALTQLPRRLREAIELTLTIPFLLPPLIIAIAFGSLRNAMPALERVFENSAWWLIIVAHALMNFGLVARVAAAGLSAIDDEQREAASLDGAGWLATLRRVELPQLRGQLTAASLLIALYSATSYGLIRLLGAGRVQTLETEIAIAALQRLDLELAALLAVAQTLLTIGLFALASWVGGSSAGGLTLAVNRTRLGPRGAARWLVFGLTATLTAWVLAVLMNPLLRSVGFASAGAAGGSSSINLNSYAALAGRGARDVLNISVLDAAGNSLRNLAVALAIALPLAWLSSARQSRLLTLITLLPLGTSAVVLGLGYLVGFGAEPFALRESWLVVPIAQSVLLLPLLHQLLAPARRALGRGPLEAAMLDGADYARRTWFIELPMLRRPLTVALGFGALISLGEFGAASFLAFGSQATLPVVLFRLASRPGAENLGMAMAAASLLILATALTLWLVNRANSSHREQ